MTLARYSDKSFQTQRDAIRRVQQLSQGQSSGDTTLFSNDFARWFRVGPSGINSATMSTEGDPAKDTIDLGSGFCAPLKARQEPSPTVGRLERTEDPPEFNVKVWNSLFTPFDEDDIVFAHYDPWGFWCIGSGGGTEYFYFCSLVQTGGSAGTDTTATSWRYDFQDVNDGGNVILSDHDPGSAVDNWYRRPNVGQLSQGTRALVLRSTVTGSNLNVLWVNEALIAGVCEPAPAGIMELQAASAIGADLGLGWDTLDYFDYQASRGAMTLDPATGIFTLDEPGFWDLDVSLNFSHNESNQGRETFVRFYNITQATSATDLPIPIGRNQPGTTFFDSYRFDNVNAGDQWRMELGGGDIITSVVYNTLAIKPTKI